LTNDELNQNQKPDPEEEKPEESEATKIVELERLLAEKDEKLVQTDARIAELEQAIAELSEKFKAASDSLVEAVDSYKATVVQANSEVPEELINGDSIESIDASLEKAKTLIGRVRQGLEAEISAAKIPMGAPQRTPPDLSGLSPREKIQFAIGGKK